MQAVDSTLCYVGSSTRRQKKGARLDVDFRAPRPWTAATLNALVLDDRTELKTRPEGDGDTGRTGYGVMLRGCRRKRESGEISNLHAACSCFRRDGRPVARGGRLPGGYGQQACWRYRELLHPIAQPPVPLLTACEHPLRL